MIVTLVKADFLLLSTIEPLLRYF